MAQLDDIYTTSTYLIPWVTLLIALGGSLHCVGMCGGLVMAFAPTTKSSINYQLGRLIGYVSIGVLASFIGDIISKYFQSDIITLLMSIFMGFLLIMWGIKLINQKKLKMRLPSFVGNFATSLYKIKLIRELQNKNIKALLLGFLSIFLPCGFLYGLVLVVAVYNNPLLAGISMLTFWLGTLPALTFAPKIFQKLLNPIRNKAPFLSSSFLIIIGITTISFRLYQFLTTGHCH